MHPAPGRTQLRNLKAPTHRLSAESLDHDLRPAAEQRDSVGFWVDSADTAAIGVQTRGLDIAINAKRQVSDAAAPRQRASSSAGTSSLPPAATPDVSTTSPGLGPSSMPYRPIRDLARRASTLLSGRPLIGL
jgi:hypothetical protein